MSDRRTTPANGRVAAAWLKGQVAAERFVEGVPRRVLALVADLCSVPGGARDTQLLLGAAVTVFEERDGWAFVQARADGYVGYVAAAALGVAPEPTHWVAVPASHLYAAPEVKAPETGELVFGAGVAVTGERDAFLETPEGFAPAQHLRPLDRRFTDWVRAAELHLGAPYLWGGTSIRGIDCSGLVQAALRAAGRDCPRDSDQQAAALGALLPADAALRRGDLVFWQGHVGVMIDGATLLHANAHHMAVAGEPLADAIARIAAAGDGLVTARRRL